MNLLLTTLLGCLVLALPLASGEKIKWCVHTQNELKKCTKLAGIAPDLECFVRPTVTDCMLSIKEGSADAITVDGKNIYLGGLINYKLHPIIAEKYKSGQETCYSVAVAKKDTGFSINDLSGKKSCHSLYKSPGGWNIPMGRLVSEKKISWEANDQSLETAVSEFFSDSCVPTIPKAKYPNLCQACSSNCCPSENCNGGEAAFGCMKKDGGHVAFVCHNEIPSAEKANYELLCLDGTRKNVDDYKNCHLGKEPAHAVISRKEEAGTSERIYKLLSQISPSNLFSSDGVKDLMFSDSASGLIKLPDITDSFLYLKEDYYEIMRALKDGSKSTVSSPRTIQWCTVGHAEKNKCDILQVPRMGCQTASSVDECITKVMRGELDAFAADGGHVWNADKCGLVAAMAEQYDADKCTAAEADAASYYVVAVVKKGSGVTWNNLKGKKSCHTGLNRNAGWKVPKAMLCIKKNECDMYTFFSKGCAPGAQPDSNLCKLCKGSGKTVGEVNMCKASSEDMYFGYDGAFRCLVEAGDVAFIKHSIVSSYTDGKGPDWAKNLKSDDFELICPALPDKTVKSSEFEKCNLAVVPAHAVITREDVRNDVVGMLKEAQASGYELFKSTGGRNLLFTDSTKCLQEIKKSNEEFLTKAYSDIIENNYKIDKNFPEVAEACTMNNYVVEE